jgi:phospholipid/cholesterol/gamma-HCH transport system substrate-binding protein
MIKEEDIRFKHLEKKVGAFALLAIVGILAVVLLIGMENDLFTQKYRLRFTVEKGTGFSRGMPVKLSGFRVGRIKAISLNEKAMVDIDIEIDRKYQKWTRKDSTARLVKEGLVGDNIIEVSAGSPSAEILKDGDTIGYVKSKGLEELANDISEKVTPVLIEMRDIISYVNDPDGDIKQSMHSIRTLAGDLNETRRLADTLLLSTNANIGRLAVAADKSLENANTKINSLEPIMTKVDANLSKLPPILDKVDATLSNLEKSSVYLRETSQKAMLRVIPLLDRTDDVMQGADTVMNALKDTWPIKGHVPAPTYKAFVPGDSHE